MVLDERGGWIPLADKLRKEKQFLRHLEQGEILYNGLWTKMSLIPRTAGHPEETKHIFIDNHVPVTDKNKHMPIDQVARVHDEAKRVPLETPEETVSYSTETLHDLSSNIVTIELESDYPPETKILSIVRPGQNVSTSGPEETAVPRRNLPTGREKQADDLSEWTTPDRTVAELTKVPPETEFEETVLYNINVLRQTDHKKLDTGAAAEATTLSRPVSNLRRNDDFFFGHGNPKRINAVGVVVTVIIVICLLAVLIRFLI